MTLYINYLQYILQTGQGGGNSGGGWINTLVTVGGKVIETAITGKCMKATRNKYNEPLIFLLITVAYSCLIM